jgi:exopolysaccharide production protein ExoY
MNMCRIAVLTSLNCRFFPKNCEAIGTMAVIFVFTRNRNIVFFWVPDMDGLAKGNTADQETLLVFATSPRPIGLTSKRVIDIVLALSAIVLLAPFFIICFVATACSSPGPVLFRHKRVGFNGKRFDCLKFRTIAVDAPERLRRHLETDPVAAAEWLANRKLRNDPRVTVIGAILRRSSLDELPQLFNVVKGEMSIVGPRPVTEEELSRYSIALGDYYACRPGITGLWQVNGRSRPCSTGASPASAIMHATGQ